ncbi:MAG TPA: electron transport complex subunit RsxC [Povalibacter sp.]|uniref:electron transport complex subunit RsxC n=1 Tax=Povalibacter sp. TaxID=1962978 RepID=UPI002BA8C1D7|nr:electron transport complex subunit RsxC [Povalibacter sp.]HMN43481.1 electron transport complex subunit RsxC [Povalibacter sp.]
MGARIRGGLTLDANKTRSTRLALRAATVPERLILPLDQHAGAPSRPIVQPGDAVLLGQPIAEPQGDISAWLHSPVSGTILSSPPPPAGEGQGGGDGGTAAPHPNLPPQAGEGARSIVIANDGRDARYAQSPVDYPSLSAADLRAHIARGGIVGLGGATFPTAAKLARSADVDGIHLLLNGAECEPWISCDDMLMRERAADVVFGARILKHATGATQCTIAIEDDVPQAEAALRSALRETNDIAISIQRDIYPAGGERQLILAITGREVPSDGLPADIGIVVQNVGTAAAAARWIRDGEPLISRIVTVTGAGVSEPANLEVRLGTPVASLIADCGGYVADVQQLIMGGSMMGQALTSDQLPVVKAMNCIIAATAADLQPRGAEMPCIRCGDCAQVCPATLLPQQLHWHAQAGDLANLERYGLMDCIECGCCDYVCPSQIPLTQRFREAKPALLATLRARRDATTARAHYEARGDRLQRIEQEQRTRLEEKRRHLAGRKS